MELNENAVNSSTGEHAGVYTVTPLNVQHNSNETLRDRWMSAVNRRFASGTVEESVHTGLNLHLTPQQLTALSKAGKGTKQDKRRSLQSVDESVLSLPSSAVFASTTQTNTTSQAGNCSTITVTSPSASATGVSTVGVARSSTPSISSQSVAESSMGPLRSGKIYSPSRVTRASTSANKGLTKVSSRRVNPYTANEREVDRYDVERQAAEKRKPSGSPPGNATPACKKQPVATDILTPESMEIGAEVEIAEIAETDDSDNTPVGSSESSVINSIRSMMKSTLDKITLQTNEMKRYNDECIKVISDKNESCVSSVENLQRVVESHGKNLDAYKSELNAVKQDVNSVNRSLNTVKADLDKRLVDLTTQTKELADKSASHKMDLSDNTRTYIESLESRIKELEEKGVTPGQSKSSDSTFTIERTIMMYKVYMKESMTVDEIVSLILHGALSLKAVKVVRVEDMGKWMGRHTLKVELDSAEAVSKVMDCKSLLGSATLKDLRAVFIRRSRPMHERVRSHNHKIMMKEMKIQGKYRTDRNGRLVLNNTSDEIEMVNTDEMDLEASDETIDRREDPPQRGRGRGRGRGGRGRGGCGRRGRVFVGPQRPPLQLDQAVIDAFSRSNQSTREGAGSTTDNGP